MNVKHIACTLQVKALGGDGTFSGYASVFGKVDHQNEIVAPGAFARSLKQWQQQSRLPAMLWMHDPTQPIGLWQSVQEDSTGLLVDGRLALRTQKGGDAYELLKMGALTGLSIGYGVIASRADTKRKARVLTDVDLFEISLVTFPANEAARVSVVKSPAAPKPQRGEGGTVAAGAAKASLRDDMRAVAARLQQAASTLRGCGMSQ